MGDNSYIFLTSSTKKMYDFNGKSMIESFLKFTSNKIIYMTENFNINSINDRIIEHRLDEYHYLKDWLEKNKNIIPKKYGGICDDDKYIFQNPYNEKTSLWFRKIASLHYVYNNYILTNKYVGIIWIDIDCEIKRKIKLKFINNYLFNKKNIFLCMGEKRMKDGRGVESGFWGIRNNFSLLTDTFKLYDNGLYKKSLYWGDGHILGYLIKNNKDDYDYNDLSENLNVGNVILYTTPLNQYIVHHKGKHGNLNIY